MSQRSIDKKPNPQGSLVPNVIQSKISKPWRKYKCLFKKRTHIFFHRAPLLFPTSINSTPKAQESKTDDTSFPFDSYYKSFAISQLESSYKRNDSNKLEKKSSVTNLNPLPTFDSFHLEYVQYYLDILKKYIAYMNSLLANNIYIVISYLENVALYRNFSQDKCIYYNPDYFPTMNIVDENNEIKMSSYHRFHFNKKLLNEYVLTFNVNKVIIIALYNSKGEEKRREEKRNL